ncbi:hypothetical protein, partial [Halomicrococcus sp. NG-SE-24]|uniref:hypothetical protein n=1 Tax=Halomicrococcus sp. NG-SE-24 TaxID=3436928 RepID=UPI003D983BE3
MDRSVACFTFFAGAASPRRRRTDPTRENDFARSFRRGFPGEGTRLRHRGVAVDESTLLALRPQFYRLSRVSASGSFERAKLARDDETPL